MNREDFRTSKGSANYSMFEKYGLADYYDDIMGNASFTPAEFEAEKSNIMRLIQENEGWVLGFGQAAHYGEDFWYVTDWLE